MGAEVMSMAEIESTAKNLGLDLYSIDFDSISLPPDDDDLHFHADLQSDDEDLFSDIELDTSFGNIIVVDNLPVVRPEKFERLEAAVRNLYERLGVIKEDGFWMPLNPLTEETLGYCFIEFNTHEEAELAREHTSGIKFDTKGKYILAVNLLDEFDRLMNTPDEWTPPDEKSYCSTKENLQHWLTDEKGRDQFLIRVGLDTEVYWNDPRQLKPEFVHTLKNTDSSLQFSPLGTYIATVHEQGVLLWGGATAFNRLIRCAHPEVKFIDFSPGEKYLVTCSTREPINPGDKQGVLLNIFDARTGEVKKSFSGCVDDLFTGGTGGTSVVPWPYFRWSGGKDDKYFARMGKNSISVYETETMSVIAKKPLKIENVADFCWSPTDPVIAAFVPELSGGTQPARVILIHIPSQQEVRMKTMFGVSDCKMHWQSNGEYLAIERHTRSKKGSHAGFEIFRIKERAIPVEVLEWENRNDKIISFSWEPNGHRFAVNHGNDVKHETSFFCMGSTQRTGKLSKLTSLQGRQTNSLHWSPAGRFIILAGLDDFNGKLEFYDVDELQTIALVEHYLASDVAWDPTGRYVATSVASMHGLENGFNIWSSFGKLLYRVPNDHFIQFLWRPRPPSLLEADKEEEIVKNLKKYSKRYEDEDREATTLMTKLNREQRKMLRDDFRKWVMLWKQLYKEERDARNMLRDGEESEEEEENQEMYVEVNEVVDVVKEVV